MTIETEHHDEEVGRRSTMYRHLGAHVGQHDGQSGTWFSVWAPNAREVSVICDGSGWQHESNSMHPSDAGIWSVFVAGVAPGERYKYSIRNMHGGISEKSDPYGYQCEFRPDSASIVCDLDAYDWDDHDWLHLRTETDWLEQPISIYEVHLGSWRRPTDGRMFLSYEELADQLAGYCLEMGYTHLQLLPVTEHPFDGSWGYQVTGFFAPTSRFGSPHGFMHFVDRCHQAGIGVILDWVPGHFPNDPHGLGRFDGTALYEHEDPRSGIHPDWDTFIFNYGRTEVREFLLSSARFWCDRYHIDGLRVDAVASMLYLDYSREEGEWLPNQFGGRENLDAISLLRDFNTIIHRDFPGVFTVAEESTSWKGVSRPVYDDGLGFTMKWDMGWMNDTLEYLKREPVHRTHHQNDLSFRMMYAFSENFVLPLSHDEVVHMKGSLLSRMPGDHWQQFANLRLLYGYQYGMPGKKLLFMGGELGQWSEWNHDSQIDWALCGQHYHDGLRSWIGDLNRVYKENPALHQVDFDEEGFQWIDCDDFEKSIFSFIRWSRDRRECVIAVFNFTPVLRDAYRLGVPRPGFYSEILNSDAGHYAGGNVGNTGGLYSEDVPSHHFDVSVSLTLPPLGVVFLKPLN